MPRYLRSWWNWVGIAAIVVVAVLLLLPAVQRVHWVGGTDLEIQCIVKDATTGAPIQGATIEVKSQGGLCAESEKGDFVLVTDAIGSVKRLVKDCMCFGTSGWNIDTYVVHLPWWFYRVKAEGYVESDWMELDVPGNIRRVQRGKPAATLVLEINLRK
jgi:hypothetical protein